MIEIKLEYPDSSIHDIVVRKLLYNSKLNKYILTYHDKTLGNDMVTVLEREGDTFIKNPNHETSALFHLYFGAHEVSPEILPRNIGCIKKVQSAAQFIVYQDINTNDLYVDSRICEKYGIAGLGRKRVSGLDYFRVTSVDVQAIEERSKNENPCLKASYQKIVLTLKNRRNNASQSSSSNNLPTPPNRPTITIPTETFLVYRDTDNINDLYLEETLCKRFGIAGTPSTHLEGKRCYKVTSRQIQEIEQRRTSPRLVAKYKDIKVLKIGEIVTKPIVTPPKETFTYYEDNRTGVLYIERNIYELCRRHNIEVTGSPRIIEGKNCYSIERDQLERITTISGYKANRELVYVPDLAEVKVQEIQPQANEEVRQTMLVTICRLNGKLFIPKDIKEAYLGESNSKRIKVDGKVYEEITEEELVLIKLEAKKAGMDISLQEKTIRSKKQNNELEAMFRGSNSDISDKDKNRRQ